MATVFDYLDQYGAQNFTTTPLTVVDAAILAQLAYCDFSGRPSGRLRDINADQAAQMVAGTWQEDANQRLLTTLAASARYRDVAWLQPVTRSDAERQQEFSAVTWRLTPDCYYLSFRGTRASFVDWKEDFNMTFLDAIPSQQAALTYLQHIATQYPGHYYLGGHSKGGNLATFAFAHAGKLAGKIRMVYNLDGPGLQNPLPLSSKVLKLVPQSSLIGMILDPSQDFAVVHSTAIGFRQHDLFTWEVNDHNFVYLPATDRGSQYAQKLLADWVAGLDDTTKQQALDAAYNVIAGTQGTNFADLGKEPVQNAKALLSGLHAADDGDRAAWRAVASGLARALRANPPKPWQK